MSDPASWHAVRHLKPYGGSEFFDSDPGLPRSGRPRREWYQRACSGPPGDPSQGPSVGLVVVQTFEAKASGKPRPIGYLCTLSDPDGMRWRSVSVRNKGAFGS